MGGVRGVGLLMKISKVYTRTGDKGMTSLVGGIRIDKSATRLDAYGTIDELSSHIGLLIAYIEQDLNDAEMCACLYDYAPRFVAATEGNTELPKPTNVWFVGADKGDFETIDNIEDPTPHFWQPASTAKCRNCRLTAVSDAPTATAQSAAAGAPTATTPPSPLPTARPATV